MKDEVHEVKTKWNDAVMKCMMMKFDNNAVKHRDIMTQRQNTQCKTQDAVQYAGHSISNVHKQ